MKKIGFKNLENALTKDEMKLITGSRAQYVGYKCKTGGGSGGSENGSISDAQSMGSANCGAGNYWVISVG